MFIGIGIPDSLFGAAWPAIYREFGVPISNANLITGIIAGTTVISSIYSARLINRYGTSMITAVSTSLTAIALLGFSLSPNMLLLCICAIPLGFGAGAIDSALNSFVAIHYKASHMNFMQAFYGIGVSISPFLMSMALKNSSWQVGYQMAFVIQVILAIISIISIPLWRKIHPNTEIKTEENKDRILKISEMLKIPAVRWSSIYFFASCSVELTLGYWCSSYLVNTKGFSPAEAASIVLFYYLGIGFGRLMSGILSNKLSEWIFIKVGLSILVIGLIMITLPLNQFFILLALFLAGSGIGPTFPNMMHLTASHFDKDIVLSINGLQMTATYMGILVAPVIFGFIAEVAGIELYPYYLLVFSMITIVAMMGVIKELKVTRKYQ